MININKNFKKAFTMAEAILVMTILGIIATIMISTLKPAQFKDKALKIMAKKVMGEIDTATTQILLNEPSGALCSIEGYDDCKPIANYYKKYMATTRREVSFNDRHSSFGSGFYLKDGAFVEIGCQVGGPLIMSHIVFPGEDNVSNTYTHISSRQYIYFDTNGDEEPNMWGKDRFMMPTNCKGIDYEFEDGGYSNAMDACIGALGESDSDYCQYASKTIK